MTNQVIRNYALKNIWCSPSQDNQIFFDAKRICKPHGEIGSMVVMGRAISLPTKKKHYQVYQVGQIPPSIIGLLPVNPSWIQTGWVCFKDAVNNSDLFATVYTNTGICIPLHKTFYRYTETRALIFCIEMDAGIPVDYINEQPYFRFYTNAFYGSDEESPNAKTTSTNGMLLTRQTEINQIVNEVAVLSIYPGAVFCYKNGRYVNKLTAANVHIGDVVEYIYDPSVKRKLSLKVRDLLSFTSVRDGNYKYLINYGAPKDNTIDYCDEVDMYVRTPGSSFSGQFFRKDIPALFRNVTHRDFSFSVDHYRFVAENLNLNVNGAVGDLLNNYVDVFIRHSGLTRPLVYDDVRLFELYKLSDAQVKAALIGDLSMPLWHAASLENSEYVKLFGLSKSQITEEVVEAALGYNAISRIIGDTPQLGLSMGGRYTFNIPVGLQQNSTVYEYDQNGLLIDYHPNVGQSLYIANSENCRMVEVVSGQASAARTATLGTTNLTIPVNQSYRVYFCYLNADQQPNGNWTDVTGDLDKYHITNGKLVWDSPDQDYALRIQGDGNFLCRTHDLTTVAGTLYFHLSELVGENNDLLKIPFGYLDIWLNGYSLIYGLDYFVNGSMVYIVNKEYLKQPMQTETQRVVFRFHGLADKDQDNKPVMRSVTDFGFVEHGVLSENSFYNTRDDKVLRITVRGKLKLRNQVTFSELHPGVDPLNEDNGSPYQIHPLIVAMRDFTQGETYTMLAASQEKDQDVEGYLSIKIPEPTRAAVSTIQSRYQLYSPFLAHIVNDLATGQFNYEDIQKELTDAEVIALVEPYNHLLEFDPISADKILEHGYLLIAPHALAHSVGLDPYSYKFISKVITLFSRGLVPKTPYLVVDLGVTHS